ncbi:MAG: hypothetical protein K2X81_28500 [Candidatus Obscuribacterales bacterium]|nr:hypothetical protein [Candidatus Obscuribacterales bacterium]
MQDSARQASEKYDPFKQNFDKAKLALETELAKEGLSLPQDKDFSEASLRSWAGNNNERNQLVDKLIETRKANGDAIKEFNRQLDTELQKVEDAINRFNSQEGNPPVKLKRFGDVQVGDASYRDGIIKVNTEDMANNPAKFLINTYHENAHVSQDAEVLRYIRQEMAAKEFGISSDKVTAEQLAKIKPEQVAAQYAAVAQHSAAPANQKHWQSFVEKALNSPPLSKESLVRAENIVKSLADMANQTGPTDVEIRRDYSSIRDAKRFMVSETGVGAQELLLILNKAAQGDGTALNLAQRLMGADAENLLRGNANDSKSGAAKDSSAQARLSAIKELVELAKQVDITKPNATLETRARAAFDKLFECRVAQLNEQMTEAYGQYMRTHEKDALAAENYLRRVGADFLSKLSKDSRIALPTEVLGGHQNGQNQMASFHSEQVKAQEAISSVLKALDKPAPKAQTGSVANAANALELTRKGLEQLNDLTVQGKVNPETAKHLAELAYQMRGSAPLSPEIMTELAKLNPASAEKLLNELPIKASKDLVDAIKFKALNAEQLENALSGSNVQSSANNSLAPHMAAIELLRVSPKERSIEQARSILELKQTALDSMFKNPAVTPAGLEAVLKAMEGKSSGNEALDTVLNKQSLNQMIASQKDAPDLISQLALLAGKQLEGKTNLSAEALTAFAKLDHTSASYARQLTGDSRISDSTLQKAFTDLAALKNQSAGIELSINYFNLASKSPETFEKLMQLDDASLRQNTASAATKEAGKLNAELIAKIASLGAHSEQMKDLLNKILSQPRSENTQRFGQIEDLSRSVNKQDGLRAEDAAALKKALDVGLITAIDFGPTLKRPSLHEALHFAELGLIKDSDTFRSFASTTKADAQAIKSAVEKGQIANHEALQKLLSIDNSEGHAGSLLAILRSEAASTKAALSSADLEKLMDSADLTFEHSLTIDPRFHQAPSKAQKQQEMAKMRDALTEHINPETKENLTSFIRNFDESSPNAQARMKMLEDLSSAVKENPAAPKETVDIVAYGLNLERGGLTLSTFMIDAYIRRPDGASSQKAIQELASHFTGKSPGQNVQASMLGVPGWKPVIDTSTGRPLTSHGKTVYENPGRVTVSSADASKFDAALFRKVGQADGKVVIELKKPIRLAASIDDVLVSTIHANSVGKANCANCNRALLRNLAELQSGARKLDDARLAAPEAQPLAHVTSFNYDKTGVSAAPPFETLVMDDFKKLQPGVYRAETVAAFQQSSNHSEFHTFTIVAPADGGAPYILDASNGQRQSIDTYGTRLKLEKLSLDGTRTSLEIPGQKPGSTGKNAGEMPSWNTGDANAPLDRTAIKSILDQAASTKNDSLHPESRNAAATRQMYETHLQNGTISPIELQKLLKLPSEDRGLIESLLKGQKLSQRAFSDLMKLEPKSIEQIFSLSSNDYDNAMKFLETRILGSQSMDRLMAMNSLERKVAFEFIQKAASDNSKTISAESIARFVSLHHADRSIIARALSPQTKGVIPLSPEQINLALSAPTVKSNEGHETGYAASLVQGMQKGLITQDQIKTFASFDSDARAGYSALLRSSTLNAATAKQLFEMIRSGQIQGTAVQDLSSAAIRGWVTDKSIGSVLTTEPIVRDTALRSIHEVPRDQIPNLTETVHRLSFLNELRKQGLITETSMRDLSVPHAHDLIVNPLLMAERSKPPAERVAPESIQKLLELSKSAAISPDTLEAYRTALNDGILDRNSVNAMLAQSPEIRAAAESFMKEAPREFAKLLGEGKFNEMHSRLGELRPAAAGIFPDMFPEGSKFDFKAPDVPSQKQVIKDISEMLTRMNSGDFKGALALMESNTVTPDLHTEVSVVPKIQWIEKRIPLADLNNGQALNGMLDFMKSQGHAYGTQTQSNNPNAISHQISAADPIVELPGGMQFKLRDASKIYDDHKWRTTSPNERALIESIQQTPSGKALLGKTAMIVMEEWAHTTQSTTGGISRFTNEFQMSPEFADLKTFWSNRISDVKQREATINEALREIDIAASLREGGLSTDGVKKILGTQHLAGEREFFYRFLERTQKESKPAAPQKSMEMASIKDTTPTLTAEQMEAANKLIAFLEKPRKVAGFTFEQGFKSGLGKNAELDKTLEFFLLSNKTWNAESEANKSVLRDYLRAKFQEKYESKAAESAPKSRTREADYESGKIFQSDLSAEVVKSKGKPVTLAKFIEDLGSYTTGETNHNLKEHHNLEDYATAIQDSAYKDMKPVRVLGAGFESVAILMENGMVLKLTRDVLGQSIDHEDWGSRKYDSPLYGLNEDGKLEKGIQHELDLPGEAKLFVYMQPKAETNDDKIGAHPGLKSFLSSLPKQKGKGSWDDTGFHQFGIIYEGPQDTAGRLVLVDYGAVDN